jgi:hypothetical protein
VVEVHEMPEEPSSDNGNLSSAPSSAGADVMCDDVGGGGSPQAGAGREVDCWRLRVRERIYTSVEGGVDLFRGGAMTGLGAV